MVLNAFDNYLCAGERAYHHATDSVCKLQSPHGSEDSPLLSSSSSANERQVDHAVTACQLEFHAQKFEHCLIGFENLPRVISWQDSFDGEGQLVVENFSIVSKTRGNASSGLWHYQGQRDPLANECG